MAHAAVDRPRLRALIARELAAHRARNPASLALHAAADNLFCRVPMPWLSKWAGSPIYMATAAGATVTDVDGHEYADFALGDTAAMAGHSPSAATAAMVDRLTRSGGLTTMMPTADAQAVGADLTRRFGLPQWSFTLTATDANRWALRIARLVTGRPKVLTFAWCYHGSVDEALAVPGPTGAATARPGNVGPPCPLDVTTKVVEWNDLAGARAALAAGDVAVVLTEPAMTNIGIVLPAPGFLEGLRTACDDTNTLLLIDETHSWSVAPGGATAAWGLRPDLFTIGKAIAGGMPAGAFGMTADVAARVKAAAAAGTADIVDVGGIGGTLAGNVLSVAAMRATLECVLTDDVWAHGIALATAFRDGVDAAITAHRLPWCVTQLGTRVEYRFTTPAPVNGSEARAAGDDDLETYLHAYCANRGVLITPFHNMALMCPATTRDMVDRHSRVFREALDELMGDAPVA
jgi:glutamate-1-semialdehyde 2,1-aminomutase